MIYNKIRADWAQTAYCAPSQSSDRVNFQIIPPGTAWVYLSTVTFWPLSNMKTNPRLSDNSGATDNKNHADTHSFLWLAEEDKKQLCLLIPADNQSTVEASSSIVWKTEEKEALGVREAEIPRHRETRLMIRLHRSTSGGGFLYLQCSLLSFPVFGCEKRH